MLKFRSNPFQSRNRRQRRALSAEVLESRTLLSTFYVNGDNAQGGQNGSESAPFRSIRQGIEAALLNPGDDEVVIQPRLTSRYTEPIAIVPGYSELQIQGFNVFNGDLTIRGGGASPSDVVIDTSFGDGIYVNAPIAVTIENLTINQSGRHGILYRSQQPLTIDNVNVANHTNGTGIIDQGADLTVRNSLLENNLQGIWGGIGTIAGTNTATPAPGKLTVENTISRGNANQGAYIRDATGVVQFTDFTSEQNGFAGIAISNSESLSVNGGVYANNDRNGIVSGLVRNVSIDGAIIEGNGTVDTFYNPGGGGIHIQPGSANLITIANSTIRNNSNWGNGGGIEIWGPQSNFLANAAIINTVLENNTTRLDPSTGRGHGGAVALNGNTNLTVIGSTIRGNNAVRGGGIDFQGFGYINGVGASLTVSNTSILDNTSLTLGGGIHQANGQTHLIGSTIAGNSGYAGGVWMNSFGGEISNSTISGNKDGAYGGLYLASQAPLLVVNSTVTNNSGFTVGGIYSTSPNVQLLNTIVAGNLLSSSEGFPVPDLESDLRGGVTSRGHNIFGEADNVFIVSDRVTSPGPHSTDIVGTVANPINALLGPLQDNGGSTLTHAFLAGSAALNGGDPTAFDVPPTDQRGYARAGFVDIGAFENQAPIAVADETSTNEEESVVIDVLTNDIELDGEAIHVVGIDGVEHGTATLNDDGTVLFSPDPNFHGLASFSYTVEDSVGYQSQAQVTIDVLSVNDGPVAEDDFVIIDEDTLAQIGVLQNDTDVDGDSLTVSGIVSGPAHGAVVINEDGTITYTPSPNFFGEDSFIYTVSDGNGGTDQATVTISINSVNDAPVAQPDSATTTEDKAVILAVIANDADLDGDSVTVSGFVAGPANGTVAITTDGQISYTPDVDFSGTDSFVYQITDGHGGTSTATVTVSVISAQSQMDSLRAQIQQLKNDGVLSRGETRTLLGYLKFGKRPEQTVSSLDQFQGAIQQLVNNQTISASVGLGLINEAEDLKLSVLVANNTGGGKGKGKK